MKRIVPVLVAVAVALALAVGASNAMAATKPKPGASCSSVGKKVTVSGLTYTCVKSGKKKVWSKGKKVVVKPSPTATPTATATPTPTPTPTPTSPATGETLDPNPAPRNPEDYPTPAIPAANAEGQVTTRVISADPKVPAVTLNYVAKVEKVNGATILNDKYNDGKGTYLANINMSLWLTDPNDYFYKYAWASIYNTSVFQNAKLPFPSAERFRFYELRIYKDEAVLYYFNKPTSTTVFQLCQSNPGLSFANYPGVEYQEWIDAGITDCKSLPSLHDYMNQFALDRVPVTFDSTQGDAATLRSTVYAGAIDRLVKVAMTNAKAQNVGLQYIGHGAGIGGLIEGQVTNNEAIAVLKDLVAANGGRKLAYFEAATNCDESSVQTLDDFAPYVDYIIASEFERGGYAPTCNSSEQSCWFDLTNLIANEYTIRPYFFSSNLTMRQSLELEMLYFRHGWTLDKDVIIPQSLTLVDSARYLMAMPLIRNEIKANQSKLKDFATYRVNEPKDAPGTANHRDLGKLATDASDLALRLLHYFTLSVVSTEDLTGQTWDSSGVYLNYYVLDNWFRR